MRSSFGSILTIASLLVEWNHAIYIAVNRVTRIYSIECLCMVRAQAEVMNILCETIHIVVLPT